MDLKNGMEMNGMKERIRSEIADFVRIYGEKPGINTKWGIPLVGFADALHPSILSLKEVISHDHQLPTEVLSDGSIVIAYYVPFTRELAKINAEYGRMAAPAWAESYEQTNAMFGVLNEHLIDFLEGLGFKGAVSKEASTFNQEKLISNWSQRHFAYAAGLGTFGINNMLITKSGCCGRYSTVVTNLPLEPDQPIDEELCLYKKNGSCGICVRNCPTGALTVSDFNRYACYELCQENAAIYTNFGSSYLEEAGDAANSAGSDVCGKCITASPCAFWKLK